MLWMTPRFRFEVSTNTLFVSYPEPLKTVKKYKKNRFSVRNVGHTSSLQISPYLKATRLIQNLLDAAAEYGFLSGSAEYVLKRKRVFQLLPLSRLDSEFADSIKIVR